MKQRIYIDTSIVGGCFDEEFKNPTLKLFERLENNEIVIVVSELLELELSKAPQYIKEYLFNFHQINSSELNSQKRLSS